jgi:cytochrome c oxidase assembly factor CtaG
VGARVLDHLPLAFDPMTTQQFLISAWTWNAAVLIAAAAAPITYLWAFGMNRRILYLLTGVGVFVLTLMSPLNALAAGYLFSAHMVQHILLLLIVPALAWMSLPRWISLGSRSWLIANPFVGWIAGVGAMWLWHARPLCNAAVSSQLVNALQISSLLLLGTIFWRQILAPREEERMSPPGAVLYLFSACVACSILGILITFSPVSVCPIYAQPSADRLGVLNLVQSHWGITPDKDQQIGGLLMWVPMCLVYLSAIVAQLARWFAHPVASPPVTGKPL